VAEGLSQASTNGKQVAEQVQRMPPPSVQVAHDVQQHPPPAEGVPTPASDPKATPTAEATTLRPSNTPLRSKQELLVPGPIPAFRPDPARDGRNGGAPARRPGPSAMAMRVDPIPAFRPDAATAQRTDPTSPARRPDPSSPARRLEKGLDASAARRPDPAAAVRPGPRLPDPAAARLPPSAKGNPQEAPGRKYLHGAHPGVPSLESYKVRGEAGKDAGGARAPLTEKEKEAARSRHRRSSEVMPGTPSPLITKAEQLSLSRKDRKSAAQEQAELLALYQAAKDSGHVRTDSVEGPAQGRSARW